MAKNESKLGGGRAGQISERKRTFTPAKTIEEAEEFMRKYVDSSRTSRYIQPTGVSYKGIDLEMANLVNETISRLHEEFHDEPLGGVAVPAFNTKQGK